MPPAISFRSVEIAIAKARQTGMAYVGVRRSSHYGAAGYYANMIAEHGMFGMSMCNVEPCMTVPGGKSRILGTNPIAWAAPTGTERTIMLDVATSAVAATKIFAAKNEGRSIPDTWLGRRGRRAHHRPDDLSGGRGRSSRWPATRATAWRCSWRS